MIEEEITIESSGNRLSGTICLPEAHGRFPFVLMVHGTGPLDRDQNMPGQQLHIFNAIAHCLAQSGIASLRYDKRGCGKSTGNYYTAGHSDLISDAIQWFDTVQKLDTCNKRVFVLGHSEGCIIAPQVSLKRPETTGLVLLCPFVDSMESILLKQAAQLQKEFETSTFRKIVSRVLGMTVASQRKLIDRLKTTNADTVTAGFQKVPAKSLRELLQVNPPAIFSRVTCSMLLIGGEKDLQCDPGDGAKIAELVQVPVETHVIKDLTHILRCDERPASMLGSGELLSKPVEPIVLDLVTAWLQKQVQ